MTPQARNELKRKLQESRFRLIAEHGVFAEPSLMMSFYAVSDVYRISTNGNAIFFNSIWLRKLNENALDFILCHQLMHISLGHIDREQFYQGDRFHLACDIIVNSHLRELGYIYDRMPGLGDIYHKTIFPATEGIHLTPEESFRQVPFDPAVNKYNRYLIDSELYWDRKEFHDENGVLILSPEDEDPDDLQIQSFRVNKQAGAGRKKASTPGMYPVAEEKENTETKNEDEVQKKEIQENELQSVIAQLRAEKRRSNFSDEDGAIRHWEEANRARLNWRQVLNFFIQKEICDYSFISPDRRNQNKNLFLPSFNETDTRNENVLFAVDTSGSVSEEQLSSVYSEIKNCLAQFDGHISGLLTFFDTRVYTPVPLVEDMNGYKTMPIGGGGTDLSCVFRFIACSDIRPGCVVIITDGQAEFPDVKETGNIPVLWIFTVEGVKAPWGIYTYLL